MRYLFIPILLLCFSNSLFAQNIHTNLLRQAKEIYFALKNEVAFSTNKDKGKNIKVWKLTQEQLVTLSDFVDTLVRAHNLKLQADFIVEQQIPIGSNLSYSQRTTLILLNNVLVEAQEQYKELEKAFFETFANLKFANWSLFMNIDKLEQELLTKWWKDPKQYINPFVDGTHMNYFLQYKNDRDAAVEIRELSDTDFEYEWKRCMRYWNDFESLKQNHLSLNNIARGTIISIPMEKAEFSALNNWFALLIDCEMHIQKQSVVDSQKIKEVAQMKALGEELLGALDFIPDGGFTNNEELKHSKRVEMISPATRLAMVIDADYLYEAKLKFIAAASVTYQYSKEPHKGIFFGGRFQVNSVEKVTNSIGASRGLFRPILLPPDTEGTIKVDLRCNYLERWNLPNKSKEESSDPVSERSWFDTTQISDFSYTIKFKVEDGSVETEPIEAIAQNVADSNTYAAINTPTGKTNKEGYDAKVILQVLYQRGSISRGISIGASGGIDFVVKGDISIDSSQENTLAEAEKHPPVQLILLLTPTARSTDVPSVKLQEMFIKDDTAKMEITNQLNALGSVKVFYEKGKHETKNQIQDSQKELEQWLNKLANNEILVDALNKKVLAIEVQGYASSEGNDDINLSQMRAEKMSKQIELFLKDRAAKIFWAGQTHPDSKDGDKEETHKKYRYVEIKLDWN